MDHDTHIPFFWMIIILKHNSNTRQNQHSIHLHLLSGMYLHKQEVIAYVPTVNKSTDKALFPAFGAKLEGL